MISVIVPTMNSAAGLQALLPPLVPAAMDGLVREVLAADGGSSDATLAICEDAGVRVVAGGLVAAAAAAKAPLVLILPLDLDLPGDFTERLRVHLAGPGGAGLLRDAKASVLRRRPAGLLIARERLEGRVETREVEALVRLLGRGARRL